LIPRKISNNVATGCRILRWKCAKFDFGCGSSAPNPTGGAHSALLQARVTTLRPSSRI